MTCSSSPSSRREPAAGARPVLARSWEGACRGAHSLHERESEQERLSARVYELDAELRQANQLLGQAALELDRAEQ